MKTSELMLGNWVVDNGKYAQITGITCDGIIETTVNKNSNIELIEPIPLTQEILERNGFYYGYTSNEEDLAGNTIAQLSEEDKGWVWDEGAGAVKVIFPNESDGGEIQICDQSFDRSMTLIFAENIMLHEFQNLLNICRIKKEIEL